MRQLGQAATSHSWQRAVPPGCSRVTPHSHIVDIAVSSRLRVPRVPGEFKSAVVGATNQQRDCFYIPYKLYLSLRYIPEVARMDIHQVEAFLAVGTFGGFRRAAAALRLTQPAVSARIRALEDSLSVRLFERGRQGHGLALSAAGR